jgi:ferredoxin
MPETYHVTADCIACDTCLCLFPALFARRGAVAGVVRQPADDDEREGMEEARACCPVDAIRRRRPTVAEIGAIHNHKGSQD